MFTDFRHAIRNPDLFQVVAVSERIPPDRGYTVGDLDTVEEAFNAKIKDNTVFLPGVMSRKKQVVPALSLLWG